MSPRRRSVLCAAIATCSGAWSLGAAAEDFPARPIRIIVPYAAGGITDILSRVVGQAIEKDLGQRVIVENKAGAAGTIGTDMVAKAAPDGYTLLIGSISPLVIARIASDKLPYDPSRDLEPIIQIASAPLVLVVHPDLHVRTVRELVDLLKRKPGSLNYSSAGSGAPSHLAGELFKRIFGVQMTHVPYKGTGASLTDLIAGQVQLTFDSPVALLPHIRSGRLRAIAVDAPHRVASMPEVPTFKESGVQGLDASGWYGFMAPSRTPKPVLDKLRLAFSNAINSDPVKSRVIELGATPTTGSAEAFRSLIQAEYERWSPIVRDLNLTLN